MDLTVRLERWLNQHRPDYARELLAGASEAELGNLRESVGGPLPEGLVKLLQWRNGQSPDCFEGLVHNRSFWGVSAIVEASSVLNDLLAAGEFDDVQGGWWSTAWVPFLDDGAGNHTCVDREGAFGGRSGQVLEFWHDEPVRKILAPSFDAWLETLVEGLELGLWKVEDGMVQPVDPHTLAAFEAERLPGYPIRHALKKQG